MNENGKNMVRVKLDPANRSQVKALKASAVNDTEIDYADIPELSDDWFDRASRGFHVQAKKPVSLRLDEDILAFFKMQGRRYQTRINSVLRAYVESQKREEKLP